ncbi:MAG: outer membrane lipoprotein carrier protein LolA [Nitratireductor sp.]|nr:outer membrane lipoprotein carrier protein LolA [Nitratireductor sp.]
MKSLIARIARRHAGSLLPAAFSCLVLLSPVSGAASAQTAAPASKAETIAMLSKHFTSVPTMTGEFVQFGPNGEQTGGVFYIERPGKIRFNYEKPAAVEVISNGKTVAVHNSKLKTWDFYPLDKTPLKMLLSDEIDVKDKTIREVINEPDLTTVVMGDDKVFGNALITLMFDPASFDLRQWTIKDPKGKETSVMVFNVQKNVELPEKLFQFDEREIRRREQENRNPG